MKRRKSTPVGHAESAAASLATFSLFGAIIGVAENLYTSGPPAADRDLEKIKSICLRAQQREWKAYEKELSALREAFAKVPAAAKPRKSAAKLGRAPAACPPPVTAQIDMFAEADAHL